jgi:acetyl esterase/lipase
MGPEHPYPIPTSDCYEATRYIFDHPDEFNIDATKIVVAGDSAGGNAVAVLTQRLLAEKRPLPKVQLLIYPWCQLFNHRFPSSLRYHLSSISEVISIPKLAAWYLGAKDNAEEVEALLISNNHTALLTDSALRAKLNSYMDVSKIPEKYRVGHAYYSHSEALKNPLKDPKTLDESSVLKKDKKMASLLKQLYDPSISPLFADEEKLVGLPKTYILVLEWDNLKDEGLSRKINKKIMHIYINPDF